MATKAVTAFYSDSDSDGSEEDVGKLPTKTTETTGTKILPKKLMFPPDVPVKSTGQPTPTFAMRPTSTPVVQMTSSTTGAVAPSGTPSGSRTRSTSTVAQTGLSTGYSEEFLRTMIISPWGLYRAEHKYKGVDIYYERLSHIGRAMAIGPVLNTNEPRFVSETRAYYDVELEQQDMERDEMPIEVLVANNQLVLKELKIKLNDMTSQDTVIYLLRFIGLFENKVKKNVNEVIKIIKREIEELIVKRNNLKVRVRNSDIISAWNKINTAIKNNGKPVEIMIYFTPDDNISLVMLLREFAADASKAESFPPDVIIAPDTPALSLLDAYFDEVTVNKVEFKSSIAALNAIKAAQKKEIDDRIKEEKARKLRIESILRESSTIYGGIGPVTPSPLEREGEELEQEQETENLKEEELDINEILEEQAGETTVDLSEMQPDYIAFSSNINVFTPVQPSDALDWSTELATLYMHLRDDVMLPYFNYRRSSVEVAKSLSNLVYSKTITSQHSNNLVLTFLKLINDLWANPFKLDAVKTTIDQIRDKYKSTYGLILIKIFAFWIAHSAKFTNKNFSLSDVLSNFDSTERLILMDSEIENSQEAVYNAIMAPMPSTQNTTTSGIVSNILPTISALPSGTTTSVNAPQPVSVIAIPSTSTTGTGTGTGNPPPISTVAPTKTTILPASKFNFVTTEIGLTADMDAEKAKNRELTTKLDVEKAKNVELTTNLDMDKAKNLQLTTRLDVEKNNNFEQLKKTIGMRRVSFVAYDRLTLPSPKSKDVPTALFKLQYIHNDIERERLLKPEDAYGYLAEMARHTYVTKNRTAKDFLLHTALEDLLNAAIATESVNAFRIAMKDAAAFVDEYRMALGSDATIKVLQSKLIGLEGTYLKLRGNTLYVIGMAYDIMDVYVGIVHNLITGTWYISNAVLSRLVDLFASFFKDVNMRYMPETSIYAYRSILNMVENQTYTRMFYSVEGFLLTSIIEHVKAINDAVYGKVFKTIQPRLFSESVNMELITLLMIATALDPFDSPVYDQDDYIYRYIAQTSFGDRTTLDLYKGGSLPAGALKIYRTNLMSEQQPILRELFRTRIHGDPDDLKSQLLTDRHSRFEKEVNGAVFQKQYSTLKPQEKDIEGLAGDPVILRMDDPLDDSIDAMRIISNIHVGFEKNTYVNRLKSLLDGLLSFDPALIRDLTFEDISFQILQPLMKSISDSNSVIICLLFHALDRLVVIRAKEGEKTLLTRAFEASERTDWPEPKEDFFLIMVWMVMYPSKISKSEYERTKSLKPLEVMADETERKTMAESASVGLGQTYNKDLTTPGNPLIEWILMWALDVAGDSRVGGLIKDKLKQRGVDYREIVDKISEISVNGPVVIRSTFTTKMIPPSSPETASQELVASPELAASPATTTGELPEFNLDLPEAEVTTPGKKHPPTPQSKSPAGPESGFMTVSEERRLPYYVNRTDLQFDEVLCKNAFKHYLEEANVYAEGEILDSVIADFNKKLPKKNVVQIRDTASFVRGQAQELSNTIAKEATSATDDDRSLESKLVLDINSTNPNANTIWPNTTDGSAISDFIDNLTANPLAWISQQIMDSVPKDLTPEEQLKVKEKQKTRLNFIADRLSRSAYKKELIVVSWILLLTYPRRMPITNAWQYAYQFEYTKYFAYMMVRPDLLRPKEGGEIELATSDNYYKTYLYGYKKS